MCQDFTHIFIAAARSLGIPARYVGGYFHRDDGVIEQDAGHAWAEAFVPELGWVGFDPANGICATDAHVRVAVGLDYLGAAPVRGTPLWRRRARRCRSRSGSTRRLGRRRTEASAGKRLPCQRCRRSL